MNTRHATEDLNDGWEAAVSAWVDGEAGIRAEELDSPYGRQVWDTYHLIGDVMRSPELALQPSDRFYARLSAAIDAEPALLAPAAVTHRRAVRAGLSGLAVAAALASVVWVAGPALFPPAQAPGQGAPVLAQAEPPPGPEAEDPALLDYMDAHRAVAGLGPVRQVSFDQAGTR